MRVVVRAVMFDFGGVVTTSPFDAFAEYERRVAVEVGTIRSINARSSDTNAWARLERGELDVDGFIAAFEAEARAHGAELDGAEVLACLRGRPRPRVVEAVRRCSAVLSTAIVTNNFAAPPSAGAGPSDATFAELAGVVDAVVESARLGIRKPEPAFYEHALELLGVEPAQTVLLDDLGVNLKPARAMGMATIKVVEADAAMDELGRIVGLEL
jgi:putative hydrolase of the HAD superfamily